MIISEIRYPYVKPETFFHSSNRKLSKTELRTATITALQQNGVPFEDRLPIQALEKPKQKTKLKPRN